MIPAAAVKERPILFSGAMVRALVTKTQTRRTMNPQPLHLAGSGRKRVYADADFKKAWGRDGYGDGLVDCPYGKPGDRLWVRETIAVHSRYCEGQGTGYTLVYRADKAERELEADTSVNPTFDRFPHQKIADEGWRPSIFMPRWACRIVLEITDVRVERLQAISEEDAKAEGIRWSEAGPLHAHIGLSHVDGAECGFPTAVEAYRALWSDINGAGAWDANPYVWALTFRRVTP